MFLKKRPSDLPKAPDLTKVKDFSLFGARAARGDDRASAFQRAARNVTVPDDVIDVEVVERVEEALAPAPAEPHDAPAETNVDAEVRNVEAQPAEPFARASEPSGPSPVKGLKVLRKAAAPAAKTAAPASPTQAAPAVASSPAPSKAASFLDRLRPKKAPKAEASVDARPLSGTDEAGPAVPAPSSSSASAFERFRKSRPTGTASEGENPPPAKGKKEKKAKPVRSTPKGALDVLVELEGSRKVFWRVTANSVEEVAPEEVRQAASFSKSEYRFASEEPLAFGAAQDLALAEVGEEVRIVNATRSLKAVFASTATRIQELQPLQTGPGLLLVESLLSSERASGEELICGLVLQGDASAQSLAVLYHFTEKNEVGAVQITVNPDNLNFVLAQFASSRRLDTATTRVVLFRNADLLRVAGSLQLYPSEAVWRGVSLRKLLWGVSTVTAGCAALTVAYAAQGYVAQTSAQSRLSAAQSQKVKAQKAVDAILTASVHSFAQTQGLALEEVTQRAGELWTPGAKVTVDASTTTQNYSVLLPLTRGGMTGNRPNVLMQLSMRNVEPLLTKEPPAGCTKAVPEVSGGLNAVQITVSCESSAGPLAHYRIE